MDRYLNIRRFMPGDAEFCFKTRSKAFIQKFYGELSPKEVAACINAYMPDDYIRMAEKMEFFMVENNGLPVGFFTIKRVDAAAAEIPLIYVDLNHLGKGVGTTCIRFIKKWLSSNWIEVKTLIVDTVIPKYNGDFYQKMGFIPVEETFCDFPGLKVKALRFCKELNS